MNISTNAANQDEGQEPSEPGTLRTLARLARESAIPLFIAAAYASWDTYTTQGGLKIAPFIKVFGSAFFFLMWLVGQYLRVRKQLHDRELLSSINADVQAIRASLSARETAAEEQTPVMAEESPISDAAARDLFQQAQDALSNKLLLPSLLTAGAAFEYSVRQAARRVGISEGPLRFMIEQLKPHLPKGIFTELQALREARNKIAHLQNVPASQAIDPDTLLKGYRWAISVLSNVNSGNEAQRFSY